MFVKEMWDSCKNMQFSMKEMKRVAFTHHLMYFILIAQNYLLQSVRTVWFEKMFLAEGEPTPIKWDFVPLFDTPTQARKGFLKSLTTVWLHSIVSNENRLYHDVIRGVASAFKVAVSRKILYQNVNCKYCKAPSLECISN